MLTHDNNNRISIASYGRNFRDVKLGLTHVNIICQRRNFVMFVCRPVRNIPPTSVAKEGGQGGLVVLLGYCILFEQIIELELSHT